MNESRIKGDLNTLLYVGRRYARADEIGIPYCVTIDFDTLKDEAVTIRNRDDTRQVRVKINELVNVLDKLLKCEMRFEDLKLKK